MLADFQRAFADLIASPEFTVEVRTTPELLVGKYVLSELELAQLTAVVRHPGMECNCMLYRANRLVPIAMNLPELCVALGDDLGPILADYWSHNRYAHSHFLIESNKFCEFVQNKIDDGLLKSEMIGPSLDRERPAILNRISPSMGENGYKAGE